MVTKEAPPEPTLPRTREGTFKDLGSHSGMLYFDIHGSQIRHLGIEDAPSALASIDSALGPLLKLRQGLSAAIEHAQQRHLASVPWRFDDPSLGEALLRLAEIQNGFVRPVPDAQFVKPKADPTKYGPRGGEDLPAMRPPDNNQPPQPARGVGGGGPAPDQAVANIPCPHCNRLIQARLLKAPGS